MFLQLLRINLSLSVWKLCAVRAGWTGGKGLNYVHFSRSVYLEPPLEQEFQNVFAIFSVSLKSTSDRRVLSRAGRGERPWMSAVPYGGCAKTQKVSDGKNLCVSLEHTVYRWHPVVKSQIDKFSDLFLFTDLMMTSVTLSVNTRCINEDLNYMESLQLIW